MLASQDQFQLANPQIGIDSVLFQSSAKVNIALDMPGVQIYYAVNKNDVNQSDSLYESTLEFQHLSIRLTIVSYVMSFIVQSMFIDEL